MCYKVLNRKYFTVHKSIIECDKKIYTMDDLIAKNNLDI